MIAINEQKDESFPSIRIRFLILIIAFSLFGLVVLIRYGYLMATPPEPEKPAASRRFTERGSILDRNGRILALQVRLGNVTAWRPNITDLEGTVQELALILEIPANEIRDRILLSTADFIYLKKQVDHSTIERINAAQARKSLRGISVEPVVGRIYPEGQLAGPVIGFVGDENNGLAGIEYAFEEELAPREERNAGLGGNDPDENRNGNQVILTLDVNVQYILEDIARRTRRDHRAEAVMLMAMDPRTGDLLGSASIPDFDPNNFRNSDEISRMDRPAIWAYEPGSVFKIFSMAALLDAGAIKSNTVFTCNGEYTRTTGRGERITIKCLSAHGSVTAREILMYSCNAGAAYASDRLAADPFYQILKETGFGSRTGAGNPGETAGILYSLERWSDRSKPTIAMGQEIGVSALQMLQAASAIANDGVLVPPRIVSRIVSADGRTVKNYEPAPSRRVLKPETARAIRSAMVDVTSEIGTGWRANVDDMFLAVKTGTAQITNPQTGGYSSTDFIASCIALLPADTPTLALYLVIVKPQAGEIFGGRIAAPVIGEAAQALADYLGIPRGRNPQVLHSGAVDLPPEEIPVVNERTPDFTGLSKRQLLPLLLREDMRIEISGDGWVRRQNPPPGTPVTDDLIITLELE
ncbi:MAG: transpeptidase family protein [Treponema sp.]|jgi:cell division protein FtsI (penicillin-binding protein 3)|nr:transpeptidase family protein [Treponema sp.]